MELDSEGHLSLTLEEAFNSTFHDNLDFNDFLNISLENEYKEIHLKKRNNTVSPSKLLRKYHKFLNNFIFDYADVNKNIVFSYIEGKNAFDAVSRHSKSSHFFQTDIKKFFESIDINDVKKIIESQLSGSPISDIENYKERLTHLVTVNKKIPIGFSTSPNISNTFLYSFDNRLEEYCLDRGMIYTRYADDLIVSTSEAIKLDGIQNKVAGIFRELFGSRIDINLKKTKHTKIGRKIKLLGMIILPSGEVTVDPKLKSEIEVLLHFYVNDRAKFRKYLEKIYIGKISIVSGKLNYINTVDKAYLTKLRKKYGNYVVDGFCHQTINEL